LWRHFRGGVSINVTICDQGGEGVKFCQKKRDVIYGRTLVIKVQKTF